MESGAAGGLGAPGRHEGTRAAGPGYGPEARAETGSEAARPPRPPPKPAAVTGPDAFEIARETGLNATPEGPSSRRSSPGISTRVLGRTGEWARVRLEGWVREADLQPNDGGALAGVTAAEVRSTPDRYVGQVAGVAAPGDRGADGGRAPAEMPPGQPYLLTRGPLPEPGFVYVAIPADQVDALPLAAAAA